ncbi:hypothetical protein DB88DRAFT_506410 [Papiliotrema laurentii]|uniref:DUF3533 domain-containing protein n=1 Tax=Papiliotrema laurentii TaxID=5418 RepID=A0AAD9CW04_PAPLA|nr:hypothetical protein DB88DRAFT_506410 [Papiliotrema laurentii]
MPEGVKANDTRPAEEQVGPSMHNANGPQGGAKPKLDKFAYGFWAPEMAPFRKVAAKILIGTVVITTVVMWLCLPLYWGSLWKSNHYTDRLTVRVIDRDGGAIGQAITQALLAETNLRYFSTPPSEFPTNAEVAHDVVQEGTWGAIVISEGATLALQTARAIGNASYNGSSAVEVFYAQARQETAVGSYLLPYMQVALAEITGRLSAQSVAQYLSENAGNQTAINALAQAPTTVSNCIFFTLNNLRPYNQPVAAAITLVGLIYMLIFAFILTMSGSAVREIISPFMTTRSYIIYRLATPMLLYLPISFFFAMINLPFKIHFDAHYTYAGGFFLWAFTLYLGMAAVGLATEFAITILPQKFVSFFLVPWIIVNVSVAVMPHELQPWIYRYGAAMPFFNAGRVVRTIIFDTKNDIAKNLGILLGWIGFSFVTISLATWLTRRNSVNEHRREMAAKRLDQEKL